MSGDQAAARSTAANSEPPVRADSADKAPIESAEGSKSQNQWSSWSNLWQVPAFVLGAALISYGLYHASSSNTPLDIGAELTQVEQSIASGDFKTAAAAIRQRVEPVIKQSSIAEQARYHADVADLVYLSQQAEGVAEPRNFEQVAEHFASSAELGGTVHPKQIERWADSLLALADVDGVRARLAELDSIKLDQLDSAEAQEVRLIRNRVFRQWVEAGLRMAHASYDQLVEMLLEYRRDRALPIEDDLWAVSRLAELRLEAGMSQQAIDFLLVEMRRLEGRRTDEHELNVSELYGLLGRGYFELGDYDRAQKQLEHAIASMSAREPAMGDSLVLLGQIAASRGQPDLALEHFQIAVRDFPATSSYLPGLLGLAIMHSVLGEHETSFEELKQLHADFERTPLRRTLTPHRIAEDLCDRHDASMAMGKLEIALQYAQIAESFFGPDQTPAEVLFRVASTSRQLAENLTAESGSHESHAPNAGHEPAIRLECNRLYEQAGEYFLRHSNAERGASESEDQWATSLWMAADSFDRGGRVDLAIKHFLNYLDRTTIDDTRRGETLFRLAQAHHSQLDYERAITYYEQVVADRARSTFAAQSYVPLAQCLLAVNRKPEAIAQLKQVLSGDRLLKPDAADYRDALVELGRTYYQAGEFTPAIEQFTEAMSRYPDDPDRLQWMYLLADSYRGSAMAIAERLDQETVMAPSERARLKSLGDSQLQSAQDMFGTVCEAYPGRPSDSLSASELDQLRRARLYRADCAFYLQQYGQAIDLYDQVTRQYSAHQSSMYALIQIVNCYRAMGDQAKSEAAHRRALARLNQLGEDAFATPDSLMDRAAWERWLENIPLQPHQTAAADSMTE